MSTSQSPPEEVVADPSGEHRPGEGISGVPHNDEIPAGVSRRNLDDSTNREKNEILEFRNVWLSFEETEVLRGITLGVARGETLCLLGGSGVGKSTVLRLILGLLPPTRGEVMIEGRDISTVSHEDVLKLRKRIGMVFQGSALFDSLTVFDNVAFPLFEHTTMEDDEIRQRVDKVLTFVDLEPKDVVSSLPAQLSGGMKKRVAIARAIVHQPRILLFDEPTSGLDPISTRIIDDLILKLRQELSVCAVVVTHDVKSAARIATETALLRDGKIVFSGIPAEMFTCEDEYVRSFLS